MPPPSGLSTSTTGQGRPQALHGRGRFLFGEDDMAHLDASDFSFCAVSLASILLLPGCVGTSVPLMVSYEVPAAVDLKHVMDAVEQSAARVVGSPITITEGAMPSVLPLVASAAIVERRHRVLAGLGVVVIPHIHCPGSIATVEKLMAGDSGLRMVAACISPTQTATVIQLVEAAADEKETLNPAASSSETPKPSMISSVGRLLLERLPGGRSVGNPAPATQVAWFQSTSHPVIKERGRTQSMDIEDRSAEAGFTAVPLVCFAPRADSISVRTDPEGRMAVDRLNSELIVDVESPINTDYVHVETRGGVAGWVKRSDVRWTPCPIG